MIRRKKRDAEDCSFTVRGMKKLKTEKLKATRGERHFLVNSIKNANFKKNAPRGISLPSQRQTLKKPASNLIYGGPSLPQAEACEPAFAARAISG